MRGAALAFVALAGPIVALDTGAAAGSMDRIWSLRRVATSYDGRVVSCKYLSRCEEACFKPIQCGQTKRDGDHDGIPCENLCARPCPR